MEHFDLARARGYILAYEKSNLNAKESMNTPKNAARPAKVSPPPTPQSSGLIARLWEKYRDALVPIAGLYLLLAIFFAPVVFQGQGLSPAADMVAAAGMYKMGEAAISSGHFPLWNPTLFSGLPMFASLQYALFVYPPEFIIRAASYIFGGGDYRIWVFHYFIAGIFTYLLARHFGCGRLTAWLAGAAYAFSPQLIVLADVGHGSKLMAMTWLPLIWLMLERLRQKPSIGKAAALGAVFAVQILALHPQVAAYGAMMMGLYLVYWGIDALRKKVLPDWGKLVGWFAGAMVLSLALSAVLWMSVLDYAKYSTRGSADPVAGAPSGGGVSWDYATGWSFHPMESITYLLPNFYGFGNQTYWGTVGTPDGTPFTHNPMYFGVVVLLLAILGMVLRPKRIWGFALALALAAWVLSFGKYLPILYGPFYNLLPMFNKFRAPVMGQVLLLLPMALLAGVGLEAILQRIRESKAPGIFERVIGWIAGLGALKAVVIMAIPAFFAGTYATIANLVRPGTNPQLLEAARDLAQPDAIRVLLMIAALLGLTIAALKKKIPAAVLAWLFVIAFVIDLWPVDRKLVTFTPASYNTALFQPDALVNRMKRDTDKFRIAPLDSRYKAANWWSYFGIESVGGYFGAKPAAYQKLMLATNLESWQVAFAAPQILDALNVRYVVSSYPLDMVFAELEKQARAPAPRPANLWRAEVMPRDPRGGGGAFLYRNPGELPRARLVGEFRTIADLDGTIREMVSGRWEPSREVLLEKEPSIRPEPGGGGTATISEYMAEKITIAVSLPAPKLLVLADEYYPSGWEVTIDGKPGEIIRADGVLRGVALPAGDHTVVFTFRPKMFYAGLWTSIVSVLMVLGVGVAAVVKKRQIAAAK